MRVIGLVLLLCAIGTGYRVNAQQNTTVFPIFEDVSEQAGITATHRGLYDDKETMRGYLAIGQAWGDYDNDGWLDLYVTGNLEPNVLYHNNHDGTFSISEFSHTVSLPDVSSGGVTWADYDNDGWLDLYVVNDGANVLFRNTGEGFVDVTESANVGDTGKGSSASWADYNNDGWLDLYVANWSCFPECDPVDFASHQDKLYRNNGNGTFTDVTDTLIYEKTVGAGFIGYWLDYDNDLDLDLYVINDYLQNPIGNVLWRNDGSGCDGWCWTDVSVEHGLMLIINGMGIDAADYDRDGDLDMYITDMVYQMHLMTQDSDGYFRNRAMQADVAINIRPDHAVAWGTAFFDYDNDGWQDLYVTLTHYHQTFPELVTTFMNPRPDMLFRNSGDGTFDDVSRQSGMNVMLATLGVAYADYDRDGDLDLVTGNWDTGYRLYQNRSGDNNELNWLSIKLVGNQSVNHDAVGSRVNITTDDGAAQLDSVSIGDGLGGNNQRALHFGLGTASVDSIRVVWANGDICILNSVEVNQHIVIEYEATDRCIWE